VRSDTRRRVLAAVSELDYRPNRAARGLSTGRSGALGMLVPDIANPFFAELIRSAQARARAHDKVLLIAETTQSEAHELDLLESLTGHVDGLIVCSPGPGPERVGPRTSGVPVVFVNRRADGVSAVVIDQFAIVRMPVRHLRELGHRHLAFLAGPERLWSSRRRLEAVRTLERSDRLDFDVLGPFEPNFEGGSRAAEAVLASGATGVLAFNDLMALGLMTRLAAMGIAVPEHLSVLGSDDIPLAAMWTPALSTVAAPTRAAGGSAVELLIELIEQVPNDPIEDAPAHGSLPVRRVELEGHLVIRESTAEARK
jgi:DNA-binding LacI/PurR family transcriptional regulator